MKFSQIRNHKIHTKREENKGNKTAEFLIVSIAICKAFNSSNLVCNDFCAETNANALDAASRVCVSPFSINCNIFCKCGVNLLNSQNFVKKEANKQTIFTFLHSIFFVIWAKYHLPL